MTEDREKIKKKQFLKKKIILKYVEKIHDGENLGPGSGQYQFEFETQFFFEF